jgi:hypothetical protein
MARWTAKCWLGSSSGYQNCEVDSNTAHGAAEQLKRIYGAEQIINLRQVNSGGLFSGSSGSSSSDDGSGIFSLAVIIGGIWVVTTYWNFFVALFWIAVGIFGIWAICKIISFLFN